MGCRGETTSNEDKKKGGGGDAIGREREKRSEMEKKGQEMVKK